MTRNKPFLARICPLLDLLLVLGCAYVSPSLADLIAPAVGWRPVSGFDILTATPFVAGAAVAMAPLVLQAVGFYHRKGLQRVSSALRQLFTFVVYYLCAIALYECLRPHHSAVMTQVMVVNIVAVPLILFLRYLAVRALLIYSAPQESDLTQVVLAGTKEAMEEGWDSLPDYWKRSLHVVHRAETGRTSGEDLQKLIEENHVAQLMLFGGLEACATNKEHISRCELQGIDIYVHLSDSLPIRMRADVNDIGKARMLILSSTPAHSWPRLFKGIIDRVLGSLLLLFSLPFWAFAAIGIKLSDPKGPVFYRQMRSGLYGKPFAMWKFRSMYADADKRLDEVKAQYGNEMEGPVFKLTNDPRIFSFGRLIRKLSIDELPQLLNIIKGDMSIVGPRPLPTYETAMFPEISNRRRLSVKPGLTCYWQIEGRSDSTDFNSIIEKDLRYIDNWSLWLDVKLFLRTIPAVLFARGAK